MERKFCEKLEEVASSVGVLAEIVINNALTSVIKELERIAEIGFPCGSSSTPRPVPTVHS